jgi:RNA polymerase sigma-70 factor (ECF subfamily)
MTAEDLVAESMVKLWMLMQKKEIEHPQALLLTLLKNKTLDFLKHESVRRVAEKELAEAYNREMNIRISTLETCNPENIFLSEVKDIIGQTLKSLPEQTRIIFEMSRFDGLPVKEIAKKNKMTTKAVEYHITRSLKALRKNLKDYLTLVIFLLK